MAQPALKRELMRAFSHRSALNIGPNSQLFDAIWPVFGPFPGLQTHPPRSALSVLRTFIFATLHIASLHDLIRHRLSNFGQTLGVSRLRNDHQPSVMPAPTEDLSPEIEAEMRVKR